MCFHRAEESRDLLHTRQRQEQEQGQEPRERKDQERCRSSSRRQAWRAYVGQQEGEECLPDLEKSSLATVERPIPDDVFANVCTPFYQAGGRKGK